MFRHPMLLVLLAVVPVLGSQREMMVLNPESFRHYVETFNRNDDERFVNYIDDKSAWDWLRENIPFFESSDKDLEEIYYFRWWTFRKHIKKTPDGFVITEFLPPVPWAGKFNTISCSAGHHFYEGRWLRSRRYLDDYARFWFSKDGEPRRYSFWAADALQARAMVTQDQQLPIDLLPGLTENYSQWEKTHLDPNGLFWQIDDREHGGVYRRQRVSRHDQQLHVWRRHGFGEYRGMGLEKRPRERVPRESRQAESACRGHVMGPAGRLF